MSEPFSNDCPECGGTDRAGFDRRGFIRAVGGVAATTGCASILSGDRALAAAEKPEKKEKPAEALIRELAGTLSEEQRMSLVHPYDHGAGNGGQPTRLRTFNSAILNKRIGEHYTKPQQELVRGILKAILSGEEAYERITRHGQWDGSGSFEGNGAVIFGDPQGKFSFVFAGHHLTVRCDGDSEPGAAFGGPMYYGHSAHGYSDRNVYNYQTRQVLGVFDALDEAQRQKATVIGDPGDREAAIRFRPGQPSRGVAFADLGEDQRGLVENVMRTLLEPFRKEDGDEVMDLVRANGGMDKVHLAFFKDEGAQENERWHYWRLEGPGFIWNYRVLPHVHCYVNIVDRKMIQSS
jgi:hypothetical protein